MYASYTHFRVKSFWGVPLFQWHAFRSGSQAHMSKGILKMQTRANGARNYQTLTVWESKETMLAFRNKGAHLLAMKISNKLGKGHAIGWECQNYPSWEEGEKRLEDKLIQTEMAGWLSPLAPYLHEAKL